MTKKNNSETPFADALMKKLQAEQARSSMELARQHDRNVTMLAGRCILFRDGLVGILELPTNATMDDVRQRANLALAQGDSFRPLGACNGS